MGFKRKRVIKQEVEAHEDLAWARAELDDEPAAAGRDIDIPKLIDQLKPPTPSPSHRYSLRSRRKRAKAAVDRRHARDLYPHFAKAIETHVAAQRFLSSTEEQPAEEQPTSSATRYRCCQETDYFPPATPPHLFQSPSPRAVQLDVPDKPYFGRDIYGLVPLTPPALCLRVDKDQEEEQHLCYSRAVTDPPLGHDLPEYGPLSFRSSSLPPTSFPIIRPCLPRDESHKKLIWGELELARLATIRRRAHEMLSG